MFQLSRAIFLPEIVKTGLIPTKLLQKLKRFSFFETQCSTSGLGWETVTDPPCLLMSSQDAAVLRISAV